MKWEDDRLIRCKIYVEEIFNYNHPFQVEFKNEPLTIRAVNYFFFIWYADKYPYTVHSCDEIIKTGKSPSSSEYSFFINKRNNPIAEKFRGYWWPLNIKCILEKFPAHEIEVWAEKGDPVAQYVKAYLLLRDNGCESFEKADRLLKSALEARYMHPNNWEGRRVGEAAKALSDIAIYCLPENKALDYAVYVAYEDEYAFNYGNLRSANLNS